MLVQVTTSRFEGCTALQGGAAQADGYATPFFQNSYFKRNQAPNVRTSLDECIRPRLVHFFLTPMKQRLVSSLSPVCRLVSVALQSAF